MLFYIIVLLLLLLLFQEKTKKVTKVSNDGSVNFCDSKTFENNVLNNLQIKPLVVTNKIYSSTSPQELSKVTNSFIYELNKVSNGCFHLVRILQSKSYSMLNNKKIFELNMHLYSQVKNYSILINATLYIDADSKVYIHSVSLVNPIVEIDKYARDDSELLNNIENETDINVISNKVNEALENDTWDPKQVLTFEKIIYGDDTYDSFTHLQNAKVDDDYKIIV